jgi:hypothetical protein
MWPSKIPLMHPKHNFQNSKKHLPSPIGQTLISNHEDASLSSHIHKNHPRNLKEKV